MKKLLLATLALAALSLPAQAADRLTPDVTGRWCLQDASPQGLSYVRRAKDCRTTLTIQPNGDMVSSAAMKCVVGSISSREHPDGDHFTIHDLVHVCDTNGRRDVSFTRLTVGGGSSVSLSVTTTPGE